jgi:hypothetical protein
MHPTSKPALAATRTSDWDVEDGLLASASLQRVPQWLYLAPVVLAPVTHMLVSLYRHTSPASAWRRAIAWGVGLSTVGVVANRVWLMDHAGYAGGNMAIPEGRVAGVTVTRVAVDGEARSPASSGAGGGKQLV